MTIEQIDRRRARDTVAHDTARAIREILDAAAKRYNDLAGDKGAWADNDVETTILDMVSEEP